MDANTRLPKRIADRLKRVGLDQMRAVWDDPASFNRKTRRAAGLFGRLWKWDQFAIDPDRATRPPRYVRRNYPMDHPSEFTNPRTRRQRKAKARILKMMKGRL